MSFLINKHLNLEVQSKLNSGDRKVSLYTKATALIQTAIISITAIKFKTNHLKPKDILKIWSIAKIHLPKKQ